MKSDSGSAPVSETPTPLYRTPTPLYRYVIFLNEGKTEMLTCWPGIWSSTTWMLERASRPDAAATWGPPDSLPSFDGDLAKVARYAKSIGLTIRELVS